jgi:protein phosphatase 1G
VGKIMHEDGLSAVCEKMLNRCLAPEAGKDGCDNITVTVVQFKKSITSAATTSKAE